MRIISSEATDALNSGRFGERSLLKLSPLGDDPLAIWDDLGTLSYGGTDYVGAAGRFIVEPSTTASALSVRGLKITFSGLDSEIVALIEGVDWHQRPILYSRATFAIDSPQLLYVHDEFAGFMDQIKWSEAINGQPSALVLYCESASREYARHGSRTASDADQRQRDSNDGFFSFAASAVTQTIDWGRQPEAPTTQPAKRSGFAGLLDSIF